MEKDKGESKCDGCKHKHISTDSNTDFCYMFERSPDTLPCGQHDKYAEQRRLTGILIRELYETINMLNKGD